MATNPKARLSGAALLRAQQSVKFKQTIIPPMLTLGLLLPGFGLWILLGDEDMPLAGATGIAVTLIIFGLLVLTAAVLTMLQVRFLIAHHRQA
jgi:hypothetical protein